MVEDFLVCPKCFEKTEYNDVYVVCSKCHMTYNIINGIPIMLLPDKYGLSRVESKSENIDTQKNYVIDYYSQISKELDSKYGRFIKFMNCGYIINENTQFSAIDLKENMIERNSIKLLLEVVGNIDCNNKKIIEIGCGRGGNIYYLKKYFKPEFVIGIDICMENIISCGKRKHEKSFYCVADAENIPFASSYFDIAINIESSFHYPNLFEFYLNVHRILKTGGYFLYADVLPIQRFREMETLFVSLNFEITRAQNITSNVLLSFESIASSYVNEKKTNEFLAFHDSKNYKIMKEGGAEYRIYVVKKSNSSD